MRLFFGLCLSLSCFWSVLIALPPIRALCAAMLHGERSWKRTLYLACWSAYALIGAVTGMLVLFVGLSDYLFWVRIAVGTQFLLLAVVPCGSDSINKTWLRRRLRDLAFVAAGCLAISLSVLFR
jgi:hypothetical protein